jgi:hypothetical protein
MTEVGLALDRSERHAAAVNYCEDGYQTVPELDDEGSASSPSDVDEEGDRGDVRTQMQHSAPAGPLRRPGRFCQCKNRKLGKFRSDFD